MKPTDRPITGLWAVVPFAVLLAGAALPATAAGRQDDPFEKLKSYDFQARKPVEAIRLLIERANADTAAAAQIEQKLDDVLADPAATFAGKQEAARFLWIIGTGRSVPVLSKLLVDEKLSDVARYALERDTDRSAGRALVDALPVVQGRLLVGVLNSIGNRSDAAALAAVKRYAVDTDPLVSEAAISAMGKIGTPSAVSALKAMGPTNAQAAGALTRAAARLSAAGKLGAAAQIYLYLWDPGRPASIRGEAVRGLAAVGAPNAARVALAALHSGDPYVAVVAAQVIGSADDPKTVARALMDWDRLAPATQVALMTVLAEQRDAVIASTAASAIASADPLVRSAAIHATGRVGKAEAVPALIAVMVNGEGADRATARDALAGLAGPGTEAALLEQLKAGSPAARSAVAGVLVERPTAAAMAALLSAARGADGRVAATAARGLGRVGGPGEQHELISLLVATPDDGVRDAARGAVVAIGQRMSDREAAANAVLAAYPAAGTPARAALLAVLGETGGDRALAELIHSASSADPELKKAAIAALADTWSDSRPAPTLLAVARSDSSKSLRVQALRGYIRLVGQDEAVSAPERVGRIADALSAAERPEEKRQALSVLRDVRSEGAVALAGRFLADPETFGDAAGAILYLAAPQRRNNRNLAAVRSAVTSVALDKIIELTKDDAQREAARKLR